MSDALKKVAGSLSPIYGMASGHGAFGQLGESGVLGLGPALLAEERERRKAEKAAAGMKKGGKVGSASKRADGCAQRGKTRGKVI